MFVRQSKNYVYAAERTPGSFRPSNQALLVPARASNPSLAEADAFMPDEVVQSGNGVTDLGLGKRGRQVNNAALRASFTYGRFKSFLNTDRFSSPRPPNRVNGNGLAPVGLPAAQAQRLGTSSQNISAPAPELLTAPTAETLQTPIRPADVAGLGDFDPRTSFLEQGTTIRRGRQLFSTNIHGQPNAALQGWNVRLTSPTRTQINYSRITGVPPAVARPAQPVTPAMTQLNQSYIRPVTGLKGLGALDNPSLWLAGGAIIAAIVLIKNRQPAR